jgi:hypothetical protein
MILIGQCRQPSMGRAVGADLMSAFNDVLEKHSLPWVEQVLRDREESRPDAMPIKEVQGDSDTALEQRICGIGVVPAADPVDVPSAVQIDVDDSLGPV